MYITGIGWVTSGGAGKGNSLDPFDFKKGTLPDISGNDFPVNPIFRKGRLDRFSLIGLEPLPLPLKMQVYLNTIQSAILGLSPQQYLAVLR